MESRICYSVAEAAVQLSISERSLYRHIRAGTIPIVKLGGRVLVPRRSLEALVQAHTDSTGVRVREPPPHIRGKQAKK